MHGNALFIESIDIVKKISGAYQLKIRHGLLILKKDLIIIVWKFLSDYKGQ